jgi:ferric-dicitrate binding protein FerR (iron transport regulator)
VSGPETPRTPPGGGEPVTPAEHRARAAVRSLGQAAPDPDFRARLRRAFVSGAIEPPMRRGTPLPIWGHPSFRWVVAPVAAAALFAVASLLNQGPEWSLRAAEGTGEVVVGGRRMPIADGALAGHLRPGARVRVPESGSIELMSAGMLALQITPGSEVTLPAVPGRWWGRAVRSELAGGEIRLTSGPRFRGARLEVTTPEATVEVTGTTLAVICEPAGTCVCVLEGRVMVGPTDGAMKPVDHGMRRFVYKDGRATGPDPMRDMERVKLGMFRDQRGGEMGRAGR